ncbi:hypothetical protein BOTBODRAFT_103976, partial [Botryobasidium botryosum FD-172 SS1]
LQREATLWKQLNHQYILPFLGLYTSEDATYMISPWMDNGDAFNYVIRHPEVDRLKLLLQVAEGVEYLHNREPAIAHGDLRGPNIFISASGNARIADFGLSQIAAEFYPENSTVWQTGGNPRWRAPELLRAETFEQARKTMPSDIFSFGRVMIELITGQVPFPDIRVPQAVQKKVQNYEQYPRPQTEEAITRGLDETVWKLAEDCWLPQPESRPGAAQVVQRLSFAKETRDALSV